MWRRVSRHTPRPHVKRHFLFCLALSARLSTAQPVDTVEKIRALPPAEAARGLPVCIEGTVTYFDPQAGDLFVQDNTAGTYVGNSTKLKPVLPLKAGDRVRAVGWTCRGGFFPDMIVMQTSQTETRSAAPLYAVGGIEFLGKGSLPAPLTINDDELLAPEIDSQWVEVSGAVVTGVESGGLAFTLSIEIHGWKLKAEVPRDEHSGVRAAALMQRSVRIQGVAGTVFNTQQQMTGRFLYVPSFDYITPIDTRATDSPPPLRAVNELLQNKDSRHSIVRVQGVITQAANNGFYLRDSHDSVLVHTAQRGAFVPGDRVEAEGFAAIAPFRPVLNATRVAILSHTKAPEPLALDFNSEELPRFHAELVALDALLLARRDSPLETVLQCQTGDRVFDAVLPAGSSLPERPAPGDRLRLTGVCELTTTHPTPRSNWVDGFRLHLSGASGVSLLRRAPWWTIRHILIALGMVSALAFGALAWVGMLRRTVKEQTETISAQLKREAVLDERQRIARELHDTVEQGLAGLSVQLSNVIGDLQKRRGEPLPAIRLAQQMLRHCRDEARTSIRDLRSIELEQMGLAGAMEAMVRSLAGESGADLQLQVSGEVFHLDAPVENHLLRIAHESVNNALRHSAAQKIAVALAYAPTAVTLEICDNGCGFNPSASVPEGHFGLLGIRERANKIRAALTVESTPGAGTVIRVVLPQTQLKMRPV